MSRVVFQHRVLLGASRPFSSLGPVVAQGHVLPVPDRSCLCPPWRAPKPLEGITGDALLGAARGVEGAPLCPAPQRGGMGRAPGALASLLGAWGPGWSLPTPCLLLPTAGTHSEVHQPEFAAGGSAVLAWLGFLLGV